MYDYDHTPVPTPPPGPDPSHPGVTDFMSDIHAGIETPRPTLEGVWETSGQDGAFFIGGMDVRRLTDIEDLGRDLSGHRAANMLPEVSDPGGLAVIPGEPGAPVLQSVSRVLRPQYNEAILSVGSYSGSLQYRVWVYNGTVPDEHQVPFRGLPSDGRVTLPSPPSSPAPSPPSPFYGVYSFQVRAGAMGTGPAGAPGSSCPPHRLFATPVPSNPALPTPLPPPSNCPVRSNVVHQIFGPPSLPTPPIPRPLPPPAPSVVETPHPLPTLEFGSRPVAPSIVSAAEVPGSKGVVRVVVSSGHSGSLEYRIWTHTGHQASREDERFVLPGEDDDRWRPTASGDFLVSGLDYPLFWSFQARAVGGDGVPSEPSNTVSVLVWGGSGAVHSDMRIRASGMMEIPDRGQPLPTPASGTLPGPPSIQAVYEVLGVPGEVEVVMRPHVGSLQLRRWRHTGRLPADVYEGRTWSWEGVSPDASGKFKLDGLDFPTMWDFQTRLPGSEPSNVVSLMVWGEISPSPTPCAVWEADYPSREVPCVALPPPSTPTPVPTATPVPTSAPAPVCIRDLGEISSQVYRGGTWVGGCDSVNFPGRHAVYYMFTLSAETEVQIELESDMDNIIHLLSGSGDSGSVLHVDDNAGRGHNARLLVTLAAGAYTVEAGSLEVSVAPGRFGHFVLSVTPSLAMTCLVGNAVSGADVPWNPGLVADCEALLMARDVLARSVSLDWSAARPIGRWEGVTVAGHLVCHASGGAQVMCRYPARVVSVSLESRRLTGIVPDALGDLSALESLNF